MIRSLSLVSLILPALFLAPASASASIAACNVAPLPPLPTTLPAPEMQRATIAPVSCVNLVAFTERMRRPPAPVAAAPRPGAPAPTAYTPKTQHDNTPWRFDMNQNGRRMTAEEFDAWMKAKGIRVATGKPGAGAPVAAPATAAPASSAPAQCVPSATVKC